MFCISFSMYKCEHCSYTSRRAFDLRRHGNRKTSCFAGRKNTYTNVGVENGTSAIPQHRVDVQYSPLSNAPLNCTTNNTIDNSQNVNITFNFGQEALERLCVHPDYLKRMEEVVRLGKDALPEHISDIYFKDLFSIMKTRDTDRFIKIKADDNEWNLRAMDDLYNTLTECMKGYMTSYFLHAEKQLEKIYDEDRLKFKRLTKSIREFGHKVLWLDWNCSDIRQIETQQNDPYCENERSRRIQEMKTLLLDHIYDKMKRKLYLQ